MEEQVQNIVAEETTNDSAVETTDVLEPFDPSLNPEGGMYVAEEAADSQPVAEPGQSQEQRYEYG